MLGSGGLLSLSVLLLLLLPNCVQSKGKPVTVVLPIFVVAVVAVVAVSSVAFSACATEAAESANLGPLLVLLSAGVSELMV